MNKKIFLIIFVVLLVGCSSSSFALTLITSTEPSIAGTSEAEYSTYVNSGEFLGAFTGNDSNQLTELSEWISTELGFGDDYFISESFKDEYPDDNGMLSGMWSTDVDIMFYVVKAGDAFALYLVDPLASSGTWSTYHLAALGYGGNNNTIEISHITGYNPVPEPATILLLGSGLLGIAGVTRKRIRK